MPEAANMVAVDEGTGEPADLSAVERAGVAFDPTRQHLDLSKEEKRRTTALMLAIQAYSKLIVDDAAMYTALVAGGKQLHPASIDGMVQAAVRFDRFIAGEVAFEPAGEEGAERPAEGGEPRG